MQKKFLINLGLLLLLNVLVKPFYILGIDAEVLKQVEITSPGAYGEYFSLMGLTFILNIFLDLGIVNFNTRNIAQNEQLLTKHFASIISLRMVLSALYIALVFVAGLALGYRFDQYYLLGILAFNQVLVSLILYLRSNLSGLLLFTQDSVISVLDRMLLIITCSTLLWGGVMNGPFKIEWFVYAQTASYGLTMLVALFMVLRNTERFTVKLDKAFSLMIIKKSLPYALLILLMMMYYRADSIMLERMLPNGAREAALYAQGFRFFESFNMIGYLFAGLLLPIFSRMLKANESVTPMVMLSFKLLIGGAVILGLSAFAYSDELMIWRYGISGEELVRSSDSFRMLMLCFISVCVTYIFGTLLTANGSLKKLNFVAFSGVIMNLILNYFLIPIHGAFGAAIASLITQAITALAQVVLVYTSVRIQLDFKGYAQLLVLVIVMIFMVLFHNELANSWRSGFFLLILTGGLVAVLTGTVSIKGAIKILRSKQ